MAIKIQIVNEGRLAPRLFCDVCGEVIQGRGTGAMVYSWPACADGESAEAHFAHKGRCHDLLERRCEPGNGGAPWQEFDQFFTNLLHNTGLPVGVLAAEEAERIACGMVSLNDRP